MVDFLHSLSFHLAPLDLDLHQVKFLALDRSKSLEYQIHRSRWPRSAPKFRIFSRRNAEVYWKFKKPDLRIRSQSQSGSP